jgi:membrane protein DedA with SNARE-associated domain
MVFEGLIINWASELIKEFTYIGVFLISLLGTSTLFIPFPLDSLISFASFVIGLNPFLIGIFAGFGSSLGEITGYLFGLGSRTLAKEKINKKTSKLVPFITTLFKKYGFWIIPIAAFIPFPFDIIGISAGIGNYNIKKFFIATLIGRILRCILIAYAGYKIIPFVEQLW